MTSFDVIIFTMYTIFYETQILLEKYVSLNFFYFKKQVISVEFHYIDFYETQTKNG